MARKTTYSNVVLAIHGGAGVISKSNLSASAEHKYRRALTAALQKGYKVLRRSGSSLDAVQAAVMVLEDCPLFNAGRGSVFTCEGRNEMDASIMDGSNGKAGSVAFVERIKNPVTAARAVMEQSPHVMLVGAGAEQFARQVGIKFVDPPYFWTKRRWKQLQEERRGEIKERKFGTVGAIARDKQGNLAAATSTGGITNKRYGRVGDSPIIGAGVWANNNTCAVSATGDGEYFIRAAAAHSIHCLMQYKNLSVAQAAKEVIHKQIKTLGGEGGIIALTQRGNLAMDFSSLGMYRGFVLSDGSLQVAIYS